MLIRDIIDAARHDGCGGLAAKAKLLTGIEGAKPRGYYAASHRSAGTAVVWTLW